VYGADAVAGVVNFIIDTEFEGIRLDGQISTYQHNQDNPSIGSGQNVRDILNAKGLRLPRPAAIPTAARSTARSRSAPASTTAAAMRCLFRLPQGQAGARRASATSAPASFRTPVRRRAALRRLGDGGNPGQRAHLHPRSDFLDHRGARAGHDHAGSAEPLQLRAAQLFPAARRALHRRRLRDYEINNAIKPYLEFMFMDDHTLAQIAPSGDFGNTLTINCDNPLMSARSSATSTICGPAST
jgi:iron complex outermembrane receptor protein